MMVVVNTGHLHLHIALAQLLTGELGDVHLLHLGDALHLAAAAD